MAEGAELESVGADVAPSEEGQAQPPATEAQATTEAAGSEKDNIARLQSRYDQRIAQMQRQHQQELAAERQQAHAQIAALEKRLDEISDQYLPDDERKNQQIRRLQSQIEDVQRREAQLAAHQRIVQLGAEAEETAKELGLAPEEYETLPGYGSDPALFLANVRKTARARKEQDRKLEQKRTQEELAGSPAFKRVDTAAPTGGRVITTEWIRSLSASEYEKHRDEINRALTEGRIQGGRALAR